MRGRYEAIKRSGAIERSLLGVLIEESLEDFFAIVKISFYRNGFVVEQKRETGLSCLHVSNQQRYIGCITLDNNVLFNFK